MTDTSPTCEQAAASHDEGAPKLWISSAMSPYGNPYGFIAVIAATREEAIAKAQDSIKADIGRGGYVPAERYAQNLLDSLDTEMTEAPSGVAIDWSPADKSRR